MTREEVAKKFNRPLSYVHQINDTYFYITENNSHKFEDIRIIWIDKDDVLGLQAQCDEIDKFVEILDIYLKRMLIHDFYIPVDIEYSNYKDDDWNAGVTWLA